VSSVVSTARDRLTPIRMPAVVAEPTPSSGTWVRTSFRGLQVVMLAVFLTPSLPLASGVPAIRVEDVILAVWLLAGIATSPRTFLVWGRRQTILLVLLAMLPASILAGGLLGVEGSSLLDLVYAARIVKFLLVLALVGTAFLAGPDRQARLERMFSWVVTCSLLLVPVVVQQYFDLFGLNERYVHFVAPTQYVSLVNGYLSPRPVGMIGNPNELGFLFALAALCSAYLFVFGKKRRSYVIWLVAQIGMVGLSGSRSAIAALGLGLFVLCVPTLLSARGRVRRRSLVPLALVAVGVWFALANPLAYAGVGNRLAGLRSPETDHSFTSRRIAWTQNKELFSRSPIVGVGPLSRAGLGAADNEWLLLLRSFGALGLIVVIMFALAPGRHYRRGSFADRAARRSDTRLTKAVLTASAVFMIPAAVFSSLALMPLVLTLISADDPGGRIIRL
jgi:O-antigen ligase